jgi:hypothetical protein
VPQCRAITNSGERCTKTIRRSKYCWLHKNYATGVVLGIISGILGVLATLGVGVYQERNPFISVRCKPQDGWKPTDIECDVHNTGRAEARDVRVSFNAMLPLDTVV